MASTLAQGPVITACLAALRASVALTTYVGLRVYPDSNGDVPQTPAYPYIQVETSGETPLNTMGEPTAAKYGSVTRVGVRIGSQTRSDTQANSIASIVKGALDGVVLTVSGYGTGTAEFTDLQPLKDFAAGIITREWVLSFDVTVHQ